VTTSVLFVSAFLLLLGCFTSAGVWALFRVVNGATAVVAALTLALAGNVGWLKMSAVVFFALAGMWNFMLVWAMRQKPAKTTQNTQKEVV